jgi:hypothetical protein
MRAAGPVALFSQTSCAISDQRSQGARYWPPFAPWVQCPVRSWVGLGAGCGPGGPTWPLGAGPLGSVAGGPDRHRGWLPCPSPVPAPPAGRGLRPRVFSAHRPLPQLQVHAPAWHLALRVFRPANPSSARRRSTTRVEGCQTVRKGGLKKHPTKLQGRKDSQ